MDHDAGDSALGVRGAHSHGAMIRTGAHIVRYGAGESLLTLRCGQHRNCKKTDDRRLRDSSCVLVRCMPLPALSYSPGVMRWAVEVPAFMIHTPPCLLLSGNPSDCVVAPGTAIVMW